MFPGRALSRPKAILMPLRSLVTPSFILVDVPSVQPASSIGPENTPDDRGNSREVPVVLAQPPMNIPDALWAIHACLRDTTGSSPAASRTSSVANLYPPSPGYLPMMVTVPGGKYGTSKPTRSEDFFLICTLITAG